MYGYFENFVWLFGNQKLILKARNDYRCQHMFGWRTSLGNGWTIVSLTTYMVILKPNPERHAKTIGVSGIIVHLISFQMSYKGPQHAIELRKLQSACKELERIHIQAESSDCQRWGIPELEVRAEMLAKMWNGFHDSQQRVKLEYGLIEGVNALCESTCEEAIFYYASAKASLQKRIKELTAAQAPRPLPKISDIKLEKFDGDYRNWTAWKAQFLAKVYDIGLAPDQKIDLLAGALSNSAAECVGQILDRDAAELERVWDLLLKRFDNEYHLVLSHVNRIIDYPKLVRESAEELRKLIDTVDQQLRLLQRFHYDTEGWSPLIVGIVLSKLDGATQSKWEMDNDHARMPSMKELFNFINRRIGALRNLKATCSTETSPAQSAISKPTENRQKYLSSSNADRFSQYGTSSHRNQRDKRSDDRKRNWRLDSSAGSMVYKKEPGDTSLDSQKSPCPNPSCGKPHRLWNCNAFARETFERQLQLINEWHLCPSCLIEKHATKDCTRNGCPKCNNAKHNSLICPVRRRERQDHAKANVTRLGKRKHESSK